MNAFGLIAVAGTKPKCMIKFIFSFKKKPTAEANYNYPVDLDTMLAVTLGVDDKLFCKQHFVSKPLEVKPNYRYLKKRWNSRHP